MTLQAALSDRTRIELGKLFAIVSILLGSGGMIVLGLAAGWDFLIDTLVLNFGALAVMLGALTWLMIPTQSRNGSIWAIAWAAVFAALYAAGVAVAVVATRNMMPGLSYAGFRQLSPAELPTVAAYAIHARFWAVIPAFWLPLTLGLLLFPGGRPPTPRWRWVGWWSLIAITVGTVATAIAQNPWSSLPISSADTTIPGALGGVIDAAFSFAALSAAVSVVSLVVRYRRSKGAERSQIRWIGWGGAIYVAALVVGGNFPGTPVFDAVGGLLAQLALVGSYGIAITKYRLYGIDVVVSKTVTYGVLAAFITGAYALVVVGIGSLFGARDEPNLALSITAVAIVAVAFEPLRQRVQHWANVLVYGKRATPYEVLAAATARLSDTRDPDEALTEVTRLIVDGTAAAEAVLWLAVGEWLHPRAAYPADVLEGLSPALSGESLAELPGERSVAVRHRGEVLGALSVSNARGESLSGGDERVLDDVAAGAGVLLRNIGLNAELAERAEQLRVSRRRLVAAHDAERRRLERDLHDGAQQHMVALKVKLGIARTLAEREGVESVAAMVASLAETTQEAVDGMRAVAHGIYPPLLESEGLRAALVAARRTFPIPVEVIATEVGRYERSIEESVYFAVLGTISAAVDRGATSADVSLAGGDGVVGFVVDTDASIDLLFAVEDRIDALGGTLAVTHRLHGMVVSAEFPSTRLHLESV